MVLSRRVRNTTLGRLGRLRHQHQRAMGRWAVVALAACLAGPAASFGAERLLTVPEASPSGKMSANVEWESLGQVGVVRVLLYEGADKLVGKVEVPQVRPNPGELRWIDDAWVVCESFLGDRASGFLYVEAKSRRAYLLEIYAFQVGAPWHFDVAYQDAQTSLAVSCASAGRACFFPIHLREAPLGEEDYFTAEFRRRFTSAVDEFLAWKRTQGIRSLEIVGSPAIRSGVGGLAICLIDGRPELVYFPLYAASTADMLARVRRLNLDGAVSRAVLTTSRNLRVTWETTGTYAIRMVPARQDASTTGIRQGQEWVLQGTIPRAGEPPVTIPIDTEPQLSSAELQESPATDEHSRTSDRLGKKKPNQTGKAEGRSAKKTRPSGRRRER